MVLRRFLHTQKLSPDSRTLSASCRGALCFLPSPAHSIDVVPVILSLTPSHSSPHKIQAWSWALWLLLRLAWFCLDWGPPWLPTTGMSLSQVAQEVVGCNFLTRIPVTSPGDHTYELYTATIVFVLFEAGSLCIAQTAPTLAAPRAGNQVCTVLPICDL